MILPKSESLKSVRSYHYQFGFQSKSELDPNLDFYQDKELDIHIKTFRIIDVILFNLPRHKAATVLLV